MSKKDMKLLGGDTGEWRAFKAISCSLLQDIEHINQMIIIMDKKIMEVISFLHIYCVDAHEDERFIEDQWALTRQSSETHQPTPKGL